MFTPEQLVAFAAAGWSPEAIKEMLDYDTEVKKAVDEGATITPEDVGNHIEEPQPQKKEEVKESAENIIENILNGGN